MKTLLVISAMLLVGCASTKPTDEIMKAGLMDGAIKAAQAPLLKITCPTTGCQFSSLEVGNPAGGAQLAEVVKVAMAPQASAGEKIALAIVDRGFSALGIGLIANSAKSIMGDLFKSQTAVSTAGFGAIQNTAQSGFSATGLIAGNIPQPGAVTNTSTVNNTTNTTTSLTASGAGAAVASGGNATGNNPISTTTTTTNPSKVCSIDSKGVQTCN